jgi:hypothetical protein
VVIQIAAQEYNTLAAANNVSVADSWGLTGLSLGKCGTTVYPFGVALYRGAYDSGNVSEAVPLRIYPLVACPMLIRLVTGYLFQPASDTAVILPGGPNATATLMSAVVNATAEYPSEPSASSSSPLGPGSYTAAAGDEWGSVVVVQFTVGSPSPTSSTSAADETGTLQASFSVGPIQPVCSANATAGPAPAYFGTIAAVVYPPSGSAEVLPIAWASDGCDVSGALDHPLAPGSYSLNLTSCTFVGCSSALPKSFAITSGRTTSVAVSIDTGIR